MPLVSVIMPAYNTAETLSASIDSVLNQTFEDWELIIVNDASTDNTAPIAETYVAKDKRIKLLSLTQNGWLANARNKGIEIAKGEYIAFLDSDDIWMAEKLEQQINFHRSNPDVVISHTDFDMFNADGVKKRPFKNLIGMHYNKSGNMIPTIYCKNTIGVLTVMIKRDVVLAVGGFYTAVRVLEDHDLWIRLAESGAQFGYINKKLALYRLSNGGITYKIDKYRLTYKQLLKIHRERAEHYKVYSLALANYYRYFGLIYYGKKQFKLAMMYLYASNKNEKYFFDRLLTSGIYVLSFFKYSLCIAKSLFKH